MSVSFFFSSLYNKIIIIKLLKLFFDYFTAGKIIGGVVGGVVGAAALAGGAIYLVKINNKKKFMARLHSSRSDVEMDNKT